MDLGLNTPETPGPWRVTGKWSLRLLSGARRLDFPGRERQDPSRRPVSACLPQGPYGRVEFVTRIVVLTCLLGLMVPTLASADRYRSHRAGHPIRIAAYVLHPVGVILDTLIFKPAWCLAQYEPLRTLVGMEKPLPIDPIATSTANPFLEPYREEP